MRRVFPANWADSFNECYFIAFDALAHRQNARSSRKATGSSNLLRGACKHCIADLPMAASYQCFGWASNIACVFMLAELSLPDKPRDLDFETDDSEQDESEHKLPK